MGIILEAGLRFGRDVLDHFYRADQEVLLEDLGLDNSVKNVYFALGYEDIRCALERGAQTLRWGTGTYEVKVEYYEDGGKALIYVWWEPH